MASLERQYFWCCTLSKDKREVEWLANKDNESGEVDVLNQLALGQACLGLSAQSGSHVVQVTTKGANNKTITTPIVNLGPGTLQVQCRLEFSSAATFRLIEGNGPVHLAGSHIQVLSGSYENSDEESDEDSDERIGTSIDVSPKKPSPTKEKRLNTRTSEKARPPAKKAKLEIENGDAESSDDEPDKLVPLNKKDERAKETKGKDDKAKKKPVVNEAKQKKAPISAAKKAKMDVDESEDDEDDSEDDDDDGDDDLGTDDDDDDEDDDDEDDESDDEDDDDDDDDDENDEDYDESDDEEEEEKSDEESNKKATPSSKTKPQRNAKNTPTPKNQTPGKQTPKKGNMDASVTITKTPDLSAVKQKLLKSPNLPKKIEKFKNFMKTNMRISDEKVVKDLWTFVQSNKK